jgi:hypothetical protein
MLACEAPMRTLPLCLLAIACSGAPSLDEDDLEKGSDTAAFWEPWRVPDFELYDDNPNSATYGTLVSPRDQLEVVAGYYFIHST